MSDTRQHIHELIDQLPPAQLKVVAGLLEAIANAPLEDEPISAEEEQAVARSKEWFKHHAGTSFEDVVAEMGLTMDQIRNNKDPG